MEASTHNFVEVQVPWSKQLSFWAPNFTLTTKWLQPLDQQGGAESSQPPQHRSGLSSSQGLSSGGRGHAPYSSQLTCPALQSIGQRLDVGELQVLAVFMPLSAELEEPGDPADRPDPTLSSFFRFASDSSTSQPSATEEPKGEHRQGAGDPWDAWDALPDLQPNCLDA